MYAALPALRTTANACPCRWNGCGVPGAFVVAGMLISIVLCAGRGITLPEGSRSCARCAPLRICRSTGTVGGMNDAMLMKKFVPFCRGQAR